MYKPTMVRVVALFAVLAVPAIGDAKNVTVMTRNLYLGADLSPAISAPNFPALAVAAAGIWAKVQATNFPDRAKALAQEIKAAKPDLIGLQEAALWRTGPPAFPIPPSATTVVYDFLQSLLDELAAVGRPYDVVIVQQEADLEAPTTLGFNVRLTQRDVILVSQKFDDKDSVTLTNAQSANYATNLILPIAGGPCPPACVTSTRGWTAVDVALDKHSRKILRFINTHLEAFHPLVRAVQAGELIASGGPADTGLNIALVGDLNSDAAAAVPDSLAINTLLGAGFTDTWTQRNPRDPGLTCCYSELLLDPDQSGFDERIDHVLTLRRSKVPRAYVVGTDPDNRSPADGLWPSDHAGVVTKLDY